MQEWDAFRWDDDYVSFVLDQIVLAHYKKREDMSPHLEPVS